ncbi:MAG: ABC transporter permease [Candidatus Bathyarchaeota archaeon]|jgi:ABC-2 type transport system permease protein|nr:ABC transporter permease [Candidatus Bathyarchaeota archaeon A05DMB-5]MDH7558014.1 ABC transporter permease [Candidatus Bathyarchaeota archaeon]
MSKQNEHHPKKLHGLWALTNRELKKWLNEPVILLMAILQPIIWMGLFGKAMNLGSMFSSSNISISDVAIPGFALIPPQAGSVTVSGTALSQMFASFGPTMMEKIFGVTDYFSYMSVGMISFIVLFTTMFSGMSIVWDRRLGFLNKVLSTPVSRAAIIFSKVLNASLRAMFQATIILVLAVIFGLQVSSTFTPLNILLLYAAIFLLCLGLSSVFLALALRSTKWETQMAIVNLINLPLMFASNTFFPISQMPDWIQAIARVNPISYLTDAIRQLTVYKLNAASLMFDFAFLGIFAILFSIIGILLSWKYLTK